MELTYRYLGFASDFTIPGVGTVKRGETIDVDTAIVHQIEESTRHRFEMVLDDDVVDGLLASDDQYAEAAGNTDDPGEPEGEPESY